jgi:hypothetical protein
MIIEVHNAYISFVSLQLVIVWASASEGMACLVHCVEHITSMENLDYFVWQTDRWTDGHPDSPIPKCPHYYNLLYQIYL